LKDLPLLPSLHAHSMLGSSDAVGMLNWLPHQPSEICWPAWAPKPAANFHQAGRAVQSKWATTTNRCW